MNKSKHTPGPRTVERDDDDDGNIYYAVHGKDYAFVTNFDKKADAVLDAAAPDLLEAALLALSALKNADDGDPTNETGWASDEFCEAYCALWKAIEKAGIDPRSTNPVKQIEESAS